MSDSELESVILKLSTSYRIYEKYHPLLNSYVLDFFTRNHWSMLPTSCQTYLSILTPAESATLLDYEKKMVGKVWPLSILSLKKVIVFLSLPRKMVHSNEKIPALLSDKKLLKLFWKNVKMKKRHEILIMSKICSESAVKSKCSYVVDIGAGMGHLSRMLNYGYGLKVCSIDAEESLTNQARKLDLDFEKMFNSKFKEHVIHHRITHINQRITSEIDSTEFLAIIKKAFNLDCDNFKFGIVGLHPCGDLGATLLKLYTECKQAKFINIVGCCYMKLTDKGFPVSNYCKLHNYNLSYNSREIACHAIENYIERLLKGEHLSLKIHAYRAALEKILFENYPEYQHRALSNVRYTKGLTFEEYCQKAVVKLGITLPDNIINNEENEVLLSQWRNVVVFYSLRLLFAPLIESIILYDRLKFTQETGSSSHISSVFDPKISARSHILTAMKPIAK